MPILTEALIQKLQKLLAETGEAIPSIEEIKQLMAQSGYAIAGYEEPVEKEERPTDSVMYEIEVPVVCIRTYHVPGTSPEDALHFFKSAGNNAFDGYDMYEIFSSQEDQLDGEDEDASHVVGLSPSWVTYINPDGKEED
jgi:hypothetical protein